MATYKILNSSPRLSIWFLCPIAWNIKVFFMVEISGSSAWILMPNSESVRTAFLSGTFNVFPSPMRMQTGNSSPLLL